MQPIRQAVFFKMYAHTRIRRQQLTQMKKNCWLYTSKSLLDAFSSLLVSVRHEHNILMANLAYFFNKVLKNFANLYTHFVCVCVCVYICVHVCVMYVCGCVRACGCVGGGRTVHVCVCVCVCVCTCVIEYACMHVYAQCQNSKTF